MSKQPSACKRRLPATFKSNQCSGYQARTSLFLKTCGTNFVRPRLMTLSFRRDSNMQRLQTHRLSAPISLVAALLLLGCNAGGQDNTRVVALETKVVTLESRIVALESQLSDVKRRVEINELFRDLGGVAYLTPGSAGYSVVRMDLGNLTVGLSNVAAYANGSKVTLQFGNLTSATVDGLKATIDWGPVDATGKPNNSEAKSKEFSATESLLPGNWNSTEIVLEGVPPAALGFVRVREVSHRAIRMRGR